MLSRAFVNPNRLSYSAALLAGGQSTRMGRDKALLPLPGSDLLLWQRQLAVLEDLQPEKIFWSGPVRPGLPSQIEVVTDEVTNGGPLAGISACLNRLQSDVLVVLAVDLPRMNVEFLQGLLARCSVGCGAVPRRDNDFEPLAAVYPKVVASQAAEQLKAGRLAMQNLIQQAVKIGALHIVSLERERFYLFQNLNEPDDWAGLEKSCNESGHRPV